MAGKPQTTQEKRRESQGRTTITLPTSVKGAEAQWPGSSRGGGAATLALRTQLAADLKTMGMDSVRRYEVVGDGKVQDAFINLFRKVADDVHKDTDGKGKFGVQAVKQANVVFVKLGKRRVVAPKASA